jgi:hypothetical protein
MFSDKHLLDRIRRAATAVAQAAATAQVCHQRRLAQIAEWVAAEEAAYQKRLAAISDELSQQVLNLKRESDRKLATIRREYEETLERVQAQLAAVEEQGGLWVRPWDQIDPSAYRPAEKPPELVRFGALTVPGPYGEIQTPALLPFTGGSNVIIKASGPAAKMRAAQALQSLILRLLVSCPPAKLRLLLIDPVGLGQNLAAFIPDMNLLEEARSSGQNGVSISNDQFVQQMVAGKIWTEPGDLEKRLAEMSAHLEIVVQKYLRNKYRSMEEYNQQAGEVEEPYRLLAVVNFPANFSEQTAKRLVNIASNGPRCGVYTVMTWDMDHKALYGFTPEDLESTATLISWTGNSFVWGDADYQTALLEVDSPPAVEQFEALVQAVWTHAREASRVILPFSKIAPRFEDRWQASTVFGIKVPIGQAGAEGRQYFELGLCRFSRKWRAGVFCKLVFPPFGRGFSRHRGLPIRCGLEGA